MENSVEVLFGNMELLYENIYNLLTGFQQATNSNSNIKVPIKKQDGTVEQVTINSFQQLQQELSRIDANYKSLVNADNLSYTLEADGSISQQTKTSFINAEYLDSFTFAENCTVDLTSNVDDLIYPKVKIPITINSTLKSDIFCRIYEINTGWDLIQDNPTILNIEYLYQTGKINYKEVDRSLKLEKNQINYFGKFTIESLTSTAPNVYTVVLNTIQYTGINTIGNSVDLKVGDIFVSNSGASKYIVNSIDKFQKILVITRIAGSETLTIGIDKLFFNETIVDDKNIVGVPVKPAQKIIIFLSTENFKNISFPSVGIKIDTTAYTVNYQNKIYTLDEFFSNYVTNFSEYLISLMNETSIPMNLGIIPDKPVLLSSNFKVIQANRHLNDNKTIQQIAELNKQKQLLQNSIEYKQLTITTTQTEIDTQKYKSLADKNAKLDSITSLKNSINVDKTNLLNISKDIDTNATKYGLKNVVPKYKIIGFWDIQTPMYSPLTQPQNIIKYEVNYRYLSKNVDTLDNTSYTMITNEGKSVSVAFSSWNDLQTKTLNKVSTVDGKLVWEVKPLDSVDEININQLAININDGESVEIKVRALSEAGYPIAPIKSEWSETIRIDFPTELIQTNIASTISQNTVDLNKAEFDNILQNYGLLSHVSGQIREAEKTYLHSAKDINSGQYTPEQKNIPLDTIIASLVNEINLLKNADSINNVSLSLVDFNGESFVINNNTTMEVFAGNYSDSVDILDVTKYGSIIRKKGYIKIRNSNLVPIEIKSLVPGQSPFDVNNNNQGFYNFPVKIENSLLQTQKQILYFRETDLSGQSTNPIFKLVADKLPNSQTKPDDLDIINASDSDKNLFYYVPGGSPVKCKLSSNGYGSSTGNPAHNDFVCFTTEHPDMQLPSPNIDKLIADFERLKYYTANIKAQQYQTKYNADSIVGFSDNDFFAVGKNTCGAFLYPVISNIKSLQVVGDTTIATLIIPQNSELLVPFVYEFRMLDRFGNIDGINANLSTDLTYSKKMGISMLINNNIFKFDINVTSKLKSKIKTADSVNISSVTAAFNNEQPSGLI